MKIQRWRNRRSMILRPPCLFVVVTVIGLLLVVAALFGRQGSAWSYFASSYTLLQLNASSSSSIESLSETSLPVAAASTAAITVSVFEKVCLTTECFREQGKRLARAFPKRSLDSWCPKLHPKEPKSSNTMPWQGLLYVKVPKAASSTTAGIILSIRNHTGCPTQHVHREGREYATRDKSRSFLLASIRDPVQRALSAVYYFVVMPQLEQQQQQLSHGNRNDSTTINTTKLVLEGLHSRRGGKTKGKGGYQYNYMSLQSIAPYSVTAPWEPLQVKQPAQLLESLRLNVLDEYDFILVIERMEESVVALAMVTGLPTLGEMVLLAAYAKVATASNPYLLVRTGRYRNTCQLKQRPLDKDMIVTNYLQSDEWKWINYADYILLAAANATLDRTIDESIGRAAFDKKLQEFRRLQDYVAQYCGDRILGSGCNPDGTPTLPMEDCYENDFGCGYKCVDEALRRME